MRALVLVGMVAVLGCGSATDTRPVRYNFAVVDGTNQRSKAGESQLARPITSQLARDPQGRFANGALNFLLPSVAYAQSAATVEGEPIAGALVCADQSDSGEPKADPLCAFTLSDGKAPITIRGGTKAGTFVVVFTAQVQSQEPVKDSTTVIVEAGPMASTMFVRGNGFGCWTVFPDINVLDAFGNAVPYRFVTQGPYAHVAGDVLGTPEARTLLPDVGTENAQQFQAVTVETAAGVIATGRITTPNFPGQNCVSLAF